MNGHLTLGIRSTALGILAKSTQPLSRPWDHQASAGSAMDSPGPKPEQLTLAPVHVVANGV